MCMMGLVILYLIVLFQRGLCMPSRCYEGEEMDRDQSHMGVCICSDKDEAGVYTSQEHLNLYHSNVYIKPGYFLAVSGLDITSDTYRSYELRSNGLTLGQGHPFSEDTTSTAVWRGDSGLRRSPERNGYGLELSPHHSKKEKTADIVNVSNNIQQVPDFLKSRQKCA
ncbi:hypothetical protein E1B28_007809 [Marasmius oreades]|uniref:Uncharacterized protein n=1 Tax=Marasmius oreades TaxID=181124 RepID=A0A9P7UTV1_9AGAR|nr:uncharacterized protein E1B28_007809 [Marasmius oreades]KAG7094202.1 hypothetical protein E1B28_007809 [Marasmius oreades]